MFIYPMLTDFRNNIAVGKVPRLGPFVLPIRGTVDEDNYGKNSWNYTVSENQKYWENDLYHCHFVHHTSHID